MIVLNAGGAVAGVGVGEIIVTNKTVPDLACFTIPRLGERRYTLRKSSSDCKAVCNKCQRCGTIDKWCLVSEEGEGKTEL